MSITWNKLSGTQLGKFGLGFTGTLLKSESGSLSLRNSTDTMFVSANLNTLELNNNSGTSVTVAASVSTTESWSLVLPTNSGQSGQVLTTDGSGNSYWATVSGGVGTETLYLLEAYASVTYTLPGDFTEDVCRYSVVSNTVNVPSNWFDTSTYTFTPQKAGYWEITASYDVYRNAEASMVIKKNTSIVASAGSFNAVAQQITKIVYLNGSTDYIQIFNYGGAALSRSQYAERSWFQARWVDPIGYASSTGSVTSVNVSGGSTGLFTQGGPITSSGTITITGTLSVSAGGTGFNSLDAGEMIYGSGPNLSMTKLSPGTAGQYLAIQNTVPTWVEPPSRTIEFNYGDASPKLLIVLNPPRSLITSVSVLLTEVFSDSASSISIGDSINSSRFFSSNDISLNQLGTYIVDTVYKYNTSTQILLTINPGTSTTGQGLITINYQ